MNDFEMSKTKNALKQFKANANPLQPIIEALQNSIEAKASNIIIYLYETSLFKDNNVKEVGNLNLIIEDDGEGFNLNCDNGNKFGRFDDWLNDSKSTKNKGCGRAQFLHYFKNVIIYSKNKDTKDKFTWSFDKEKDLKDITTTTQNNYDKTRIEMSDCLKVNKFYNKVKDIDKLAEELTIACLLSLIEKENIIIDIQYYINNKIDCEQKINKDYIKNLLKEARAQELKIKYSKVKESEVDRDDFDFEYVDDKQANFNIKEYKIFNEDIDNQVYLCANNQIVKNITKDVGLLENFTLTNNDNNNFKLLYLIDSDYLNDKCNSSRDDFEFEIKDKIEEQIKKEKREARYTNLTMDGKEKEYLFYDTIKSEISKDINTTYTQIKQKIDDNRQETKDGLLQLGYREEEIDNQLKEDKIYDVNSEAIKMAQNQGKNNITRQQEIIKKYQQLIIIDKQRGGSERKVKTIESKEGQKSREQLAKEITELTTLLNKQELANYVIRRQIACEVLKYYNEQISNQKEHYNEEYFHNLIIPMGTTEKDNLENNLWMLNEDYSHYQYYSSNIKLKNVEYNGKKIFNEDIENEEVLQKCGITNKNCEDKQPDLLLFPKLGSVVIIDFKKPNEKCFDYEKQVRDYAKLMYSKTNEEFNNLKHFYCYIIGETYGVPDDHYKETPDLEGYFAFQPIKDFNNKKPDLTIYEEITKFSRIQKLADLRNQPFIDKLGIKENIEKVVAEIFNDREKQNQ